MKMTLWRVMFVVALAGATLAVGCGGADEVGGDVNNGGGNNANNATVNNTDNNNDANNVFNNNTNNAPANNTTGNNNVGNNNVGNNNVGNNNASNNNTGNNNAPTCGEHAVGERWPADDGCNTCTCTEDGQIACTEIACVNSCDELRADYQAAIQGASACVANDDCIILNGQCGVGLGGCYASANATLTQEELNALGASFNEAGCTSGVCDCGPPQPPACIEGVCGFLENAPVTCGEHAVGEIWTDDDGCNTCTCLEGGQTACTDRACVDVCEEIGDRYQAIVAGAKTCEVSADCHLVGGQCGVGLGGCYEIVNTSVTGDELSALGQEFTDAGCIAGVCSCAAPPPVGCVEGMCDFVSSCGEHAFGESWLADDGCNTCTCGDDGQINCTRRACTTCQSVEIRYNDLLNTHQDCQSDDECQLLNTDCSLNGTCWAAANLGVTQDQLSELSEQFDAESCDGPVCRCAPMPSGAVCEAGRCATR